MKKLSSPLLYLLKPKDTLNMAINTKNVLTITNRIICTEKQMKEKQ